jgi:hypothetical protein
MWWPIDQGQQVRIWSSSLDTKRDVAAIAGKAAVGRDQAGGVCQGGDHSNVIGTPGVGSACTMCGSGRGHSSVNGGE